MTTPFWTIFCAPHKQAIQTFPHRALPYYVNCSLCKGRFEVMAINNANVVNYFAKKLHVAVRTKQKETLEGLKLLGFRLEPQVLEVEA